jgi:DNA-binding HxlR family transcriptional regulator
MRGGSGFAVIVIIVPCRKFGRPISPDASGRCLDIDLDFRQTSTYLAVSVKPDAAGGLVMGEKTYSCGLEAALEVIGGKWKVLILWALRSEAQRFGELRRLVQGISEKMLIQHLKEMQADGIVKRRDFKEVPPRVEYELTSFGHSLYAALAPLCEWGTLHMKRIEARKQAAETKPRQKAVA